MSPAKLVSVPRAVHLLRKTFEDHPDCLNFQIPEDSLKRVLRSKNLAGDKTTREEFYCYLNQATSQKHTTEKQREIARMATIAIMSIWYSTIISNNKEA